MTKEGKNKIFLQTDITNNPDREFYISVMKELSPVIIEYFVENLHDPLVLIEDLFFQDKNNKLMIINNTCNGYSSIDKSKTEIAYANNHFDDQTRKLIRDYLNYTNSYLIVGCSLFNKFLCSDLSFFDIFNKEFVNKISEKLNKDIYNYLNYRRNHSDLEELGFVLDSFESSCINISSRDQRVCYKLEIKE